MVKFKILEKLKGNTNSTQFKQQNSSTSSENSDTEISAVYERLKRIKTGSFISSGILTLFGFSYALSTLLTYPFFFSIFGMTPMLLGYAPLTVGLALINNNIINRKRKKKVKALCNVFNF